MKRWFDTGFKMADEKTPRIVCAVSEREAKRFLVMGWTELSEKSGLSHAPALVKTKRRSKK